MTHKKLKLLIVWTRKHETRGFTIILEIVQVVTVESQKILDFCFIKDNVDTFRVIWNEFVESKSGTEH